MCRCKCRLSWSEDFLRYRRIDLKDGLAYLLRLAADQFQSYEGLGKFRLPQPRYRDLSTRAELA